MLMIPTFLAPSLIKGAGLGLFAGRAVTKGEVIWQFDDRIDKLLSNLTVEKLSKDAREFIHHYGSHCYEDIWLLCGDDARFVNHSNPGVMMCVDKYLDAEDIALRNINIGEEITEDYSKFALHFRETDFAK